MNENEYIALIVRARNAHLALDVPIARALRQAVLDYADRLEDLLRRARRLGLWSPQFREALVRQARELADLLDSELAALTLRGVRLSASRVAELVDSATVRFIATNAPGTYVPPPNLKAATAFAARIRPGAPSVAATFRTLSRHVENAASEVDYILTRGILERADPEALARRLRGYVAGSEQFGRHAIVERDASGNITARKIDLRRLSAAERGAARRMAFNARRLAVTEMHNAGHEATVRAMDAAPMVEGTQWNLAFDRGSARIPDECDVLAGADYYGLGPGVYPTAKVPPKPHPFDRCYTTPALRPFQEWDSAKPSGELDTSGARSTLNSGTARQKDRAVARADDAVRVFADTERRAA